MISEKVRATIQKHRLLNKGDKVLVGVSGGPDSVALLYLLITLKNDFRLRLHVAHFDHSLRKGSGKDAEFVKKLCEKLSVGFTGVKAGIKKMAGKGSLEEIARNARLGFFFRTARKIRADKIALGHNLDDQAETVLMRILRGTGLYGLTGISPKRVINGFTVIRPLIAVSRREIEGFLRKNKIRTRLDPTNSKNFYFRNKIRNRLLPLLEKEYSSNIKTLLVNMGESVALDYEYLFCAAERADQNSGKRLDLKRFLKLHPSIQRLVLRLNIAKHSGSTRKIEFQHVKEIEDLIFYRPVDSVVDLPKGVSVRKKKGYLIFNKR